MIWYTYTLWKDSPPWSELTHPPLHILIFLHLFIYLFWRELSSSFLLANFHCTIQCFLLKRWGKLESTCFILYMQAFYKWPAKFPRGWWALRVGPTGDPVVSFPSSRVKVWWNRLQPFPLSAPSGPLKGRDGVASCSLGDSGVTPGPGPAWLSGLRLRWPSSSSFWCLGAASLLRLPRPRPPVPFPGAWRAQRLPQGWSQSPETRGLYRGEITGRLGCCCLRAWAWDWPPCSGPSAHPGREGPRRRSANDHLSTGTSLFSHFTFSD